MQHPFPLPTSRKPSGTTGINRLIASAFRVRLVSDVPERLSRCRIPCPLDAKRHARIAAIRKARVLFVHIPKNAGTSICDRLYGQQIKHATVRYYAMVAPDLLDLPRFAIVRDPIERFWSAYRYAVAGGTCDRAVSRPFEALYRSFTGIDDAIDHLASARSHFAMDHIFRPQHWYLDAGPDARPIDCLVPYEALDRLGDLIGLDGLDDLPRLNRTDSAPPPRLTLSQKAFLDQFYARDFALWHQAQDSCRALPPMRAVA